MRRDSYPTAFYAAAAIAALIGLLSAGLNAWFGWKTGGSVQIIDLPWIGAITAGHYRAALSAGSDLLKDFLVVMVIMALTAKGVNAWLRIVGAVTCLTLLIPLAAYSWVYASGAAALISSDNTSARANEIESKRRLLADEARLEKKNPWTAQTVDYKDTPPEAFGKLIKSYKDDKLWNSSAACVSATSEAERKYCKGYDALGAAQTIAETQAKDHNELVSIKAQLAKMAAVPLVANPATAMLAKVLGTNEDEALAVSSGLGALILEGVPTGLPAILYFFAVTILAKPKEDEPAVAMPAPRQRARTRIVLASAPDSAMREVAMTETKPHKSALKKIEEGLTGALSIAKAEAKPVAQAAPPAPPAPPASTDENALIGAAIRSLQPIAAKRPENKIAHAEVMEAIEREGGAAIDSRTVSAFLRRAKGITKIDGDRSRLNGQRQTWYQIAGKPKLESVA